MPRPYSKSNHHTLTELQYVAVRLTLRAAGHVTSGPADPPYTYNTRQKSRHAKQLTKIM